MAAGPKQVPHVASHAAQAVPLAYLPSGVQSATHAPFAHVLSLAKGEVGAHAVQSSVVLPTHVAQLASQGTHASCDEGPPPEHVDPTSIVQAAEHPSPATRSPSSHSSLPTRSPSPHKGTHVSMVVVVPPLQRKPASTAQLMPQPSPATLLPSSQSSPPHEMRLPSPHTAAHVSRPPTPELPALCVVLRHAKPVSTWQSESQPSPPTVLLSSQASAVERTPFPQTCTTGVTWLGSALGSGSGLGLGLGLRLGHEGRHRQLLRVG